MGQGVWLSGVKREHMFITSKLHPRYHGAPWCQGRQQGWPARCTEDVLGRMQGGSSNQMHSTASSSCCCSVQQLTPHIVCVCAGYWNTLAMHAQTLRDLRTDYVDLFLLHYPECWGSLCGGVNPEGTWKDRHARRGPLACRVSGTGGGVGSSKELGLTPLPHSSPRTPAPAAAGLQWKSWCMRAVCAPLASPTSTSRSLWSCWRWPESNRRWCRCAWMAVRHGVLAERQEGGPTREAADSWAPAFAGYCIALPVHSLTPGAGAAHCPAPVPMTSQSNSDPLRQDAEVQAFCRLHGIAYQGYSTLGGQWLGQYRCVYGVC